MCASPSAVVCSGMKQKRTIAGIWWLPEAPDERSMGDLKLAPDKSPELRLTVESSSSLKDARYPNVLHGCNQHGKPITLFHLGRHHAGLSSAITKLRYSAGYALLGIKLASRNELRAGVLRFHMQHLFEWVARTAFHNETVGLVEGAIKYVCPEPVSAVAGSDLTVKIVSTSGSWSKLRKRGVSEDAYVEFSSEAKFDFNRCEELVTAFRHLLHFASLETVYPTRITCSKFNDPKALGGREAEIVSGAYREEIESEFQAAWWVFQLPDVHADFGSFLGNWLATVKKYEEALGCYFTTVYFSLPDSVQHICLTQALIAFHGLKNQSLGSYGFEKQIAQLADTYGKGMPALFNDTSAFAKSVAVTRHYNTHFNPLDLAKGALSGTPLLHLNEKLKVLFQMCILTEMGISPERFPRLERQLVMDVVEYN